MANKTVQKVTFTCGHYRFMTRLDVSLLNTEPALTNKDEWDSPAKCGQCLANERHIEARERMLANREAAAKEIAENPETDHSKLLAVGLATAVLLGGGK